MPGGVAFDGSPWVTAASSAGLVLVSLGLAIAGGTAVARRAAEGSLDLPAGPMTSQNQKPRRSIPLEKSSITDRQPTQLGRPVEPEEITLDE